MYEQQYLEDRTAKAFINTEDLDKELIDYFALSPFTSSVCYFISVRSSSSFNGHEAREGAAKKLLSFLGNLEKSFPPASDTDVSGIEDIYR